VNQSDPLRFVRDVRSVNDADLKGDRILSLSPGRLARSGNIRVRLTLLLRRVGDIDWEGFDLLLNWSRFELKT